MITGNLLSAAALLTGVIGALFSLWWPELRSAATTKIVRQNKEELTRRVRVGLFGRSWPLLILVTLILLALAPPLASAILSIRFGARYDPTSACFVIIWLALLLLAGGSIQATVGLHHQMRKLVRSVD